MGFPKGFVWGTATAAYQIEGAAAEGGRGLSTWDVFCERPGAIYGGQSGARACDHYHLWEKDLDLLQELGVTAYRFSLSWPRLLPSGTGPENHEGVHFYERLIDGLLKRNITPYVTLFHWDCPHVLQQQGGFLNSESPAWFERYTDFAARRFGDRVKHWFTLNEPHAFIEGGLRHGRHAPGLQLPLAQVLRAGHHALLAHGRATRVLRAEVADSWVAMAPVLVCAVPASESVSDIEAARRYTFSMPTDQLRASSWWMDPVYGRGYPEDGLRQFGDSMPKVPDADLDAIGQRLDAVAFNLYDAAVVRADAEGEPEVVTSPPGSPITAFEWAVSPSAHYYGPLFCHQRYELPTLIAENGLSCRDWVDRNGQVNDPQRIDFIQRHLAHLERALDDARVQGYFHWSLLDNFEWNHGYRERFGLVHVNFETLQRTKKGSFFAYKDIIARARL